MKRKTIILLTALIFNFSPGVFAQNNEVPSVDLYDVSARQNVSLDQFKNSQALVLIFTSNHCPYSKIYLDRIVELSKKYDGQGVSFALVNSNLPNLNESESIEKMRALLDQKEIDLSYLADKDQLAKTAYRIEKNPEALILKPSETGFIKIYQGAIDDNPQASNLVNANYIELALSNILEGKPSPVSYKRPVGCRIKTN